MNKGGRTMVMLVVLAVVGVCIWSIVLTAPVKTTEEIEMVQTCAWFFCAQYDAHYAEHVNLPNSNANLNNAQAEKFEAEAEKIRSEQAASRAAYGWVGFVLSFLFFSVMFGGGALLLYFQPKGR